jgi:hypothetical protein
MLKDDVMAEYAILIYEDEAEWGKGGLAFLQQVSVEHQVFAAAHHASLRCGGWMQSTRAATSVRCDGFGPVPGSMSDTGLALIGYYLIEVADHAAAVAIALEVPVKFGGVEIRRVIPVY